MAKGPKRRRLAVRAIQAYWRATRAVTLGAQGIVLDADGQVLLIRHTYRPGWHFPGGGVEKNEGSLDALVRELNEEAGVIVEGRPQLLGLYTNFEFFPSDHIAVYVVRDWQQPVAPKPNHEIAAHGFFPPDNLPEGTIGAVRRRLAELSGAAALATAW